VTGNERRDIIFTEADREVYLGLLQNAIFVGGGKPVQTTSLTFPTRAPLASPASASVRFCARLHSTSAPETKRAESSPFSGPILSPPARFLPELFSIRS